MNIYAVTGNFYFKGINEFHKKSNFYFAQVSQPCTQKNDIDMIEGKQTFSRNLCLGL